MMKTSFSMIRVEKCQIFNGKLLQGQFNLELNFEIFSCFKMFLALIFNIIFSIFRWIKYEQVIESSTNMWSKPFVGAILYHNLIYLKNTLQNGIYNYF
jgi:hypothetical protein